MLRWQHLFTIVRERLSLLLTGSKSMKTLFCEMFDTFPRAKFDCRKFPSPIMSPWRFARSPGSPVWGWRSRFHAGNFVHPTGSMMGLSSKKRGCDHVNPGLVNHGLLIRGVFPPIAMIWYFFSGTFPIKQPFGRGLLIQGWVYPITCAISCNSPEAVFKTPIGWSLPEGKSPERPASLWLRTSVCPYGIVPPACAGTCNLTASGKLTWYAYHCYGSSQS